MALKYPFLVWSRWLIASQIRRATPLPALLAFLVKPATPHIFPKPRSLRLSVFGPDLRRVFVEYTTRIAGGAPARFLRVE
jgi:hypothetical protein